jgi:apolipoprotein N-acyltransferase
LSAALDSIGAFLNNLKGLNGLLVAALAGALSALAFPPFEFFPALLLAFAALLLLLDGTRTARRPLLRAALIGWSFGFGFFLTGLHWIGYAFLVNAERHLWLLPFAAVLLPTGLALFHTMGALLYVRLRREGPQRIFLFALLFTGIEWLRGHILTGFPWNLPGYAWGASLEILQSTSLFGIYGLSLLTLLFAASLALFFTPARRRTFWFPASMAVLFLGLWGQGAARLATASDAEVENVRLRVVQTDVPQNEKYDQALMQRNWQSLIGLTLQPAAIPVTHIIWPEAALSPFSLWVPAETQRQLTNLVGERLVLLTGNVRVAEENGMRRAYNSFDLLGAQGRVLASSDKFHLVPFGEYLPLHSVLSAFGVTEIAGAGQGFSAGPGPETIDVPGAPPVTPLICYEVIFPREVTGTPRPGWLVNMSDDSWFGPAAGPMQHLLIARVRAIEEGLPLVRGTNGGVSAVIDAYGRLTATLELGEPGVLDSPLPAALLPTPFASYGNVLLLLLVLMFTGAVLLPLNRRS